ncbi:MAG: GNAT family N-acetyltransferase [Gammaproteobacteria bacterium]|nr:GNAT family N-acetyltransferase [Gammaproteobacteria bacterium]
MNIIVKPAQPEDFELLLALNEGALPHVNRIDAAELAELFGQSFSCNLAIVDGEVAGFMLALLQDASYQSPNYRWFTARYPEFVYVDRIVIAPKFSRLGLGAHLYRQLERSAVGQAPLLACEVNLRPANPASLAFHKSIGFAEVGQQETDGGAKLVSLMVKALP